MDVVKLLLKHGADPQATCNEGKTPFDQARTSPEISLLLHKANTSADSSAAKRMASCANCGMLNMFIIWWHRVLKFSGTQKLIFLSLKISSHHTRVVMCI